MLWQGFGRFGAFGADADGGTGATPEFVAVGSYSAAAHTSVRTPSYPAGLQADDILLLHVHLLDGLGNATISSVTGGWTLVGTRGTTAADEYGALYWKRATGSESGTITVTLTQDVDTGVLQTIISAWRGCLASGTPYEAATSRDQNATTSHAGSAITTLGPNRRVVTFFGGTVEQSIGSNTNGWTEIYENTTSAGVEAFNNCNAREAVSAGAVAACTRSQSPSNANISFTLALIPT